MKVAQSLYRDGAFTQTGGDEILKDKPALVLAFGAKEILAGEEVYQSLRQAYPSAHIVSCSTAGEIYDDMVYDDTVSVLAMQFASTVVKPVSINIADHGGSFEAGRALFNRLNNDGLSYVLIIADGGVVNGSQLVKGIEDVNHAGVPITGGLAGDAARFDYTVVGYNQIPAEGVIVGIGFYGDKLQIGHGSFGGWDIFGPEKKVTRSVSNRLMEIDGKSALDLYKQYLGKYADELPGSALLFPLHVKLPDSGNAVVRTILSIDADEQSMVFAGDIPEGAYVRFMKANFDKLIDAATQAANNTLTQFEHAVAQKPKAALLISCVGRKLILGKRIDEEIEAIKDVFGGDTVLSGFYSYGEISPLNPQAKCELHNQTMTVTTFNELSS